MKIIGQIVVLLAYIVTNGGVERIFLSFFCENILLN